MQALRKDSGLEVTDRIALCVTGSGKVAQAVRAFADMIQKAVLAVSVDTDALNGDGKPADLNGESVLISLKKE